MEYIPLKPWRQTWLTPELLHSASGAELCMIGVKQYAQLTHPRGGPLTCVENRTGRIATDVVHVDGKWCWAFESVAQAVDESSHTPGPWRYDYPCVYSATGSKLIEIDERMCCTAHDAQLIAAAPDLLKVIQHIMRCIPLGGFAQIHHGSSTWDQMEAAVTSAVGQSPPEEPLQSKDRAQFESRFPPPGSVHWNGSEYVARSDASYSADRYIGQWEAWQAALREVLGERND